MIIDLWVKLQFGVNSANVPSAINIIASVRYSLSLSFQVTLAVSAKKQPSISK